LKLKRRKLWLGFILLLFLLSWLLYLLMENSQKGYEFKRFLYAEEEGILIQPYQKRMSNKADR